MTGEVGHPEHWGRWFEIEEWVDRDDHVVIIQAREVWPAHRNRTAREDGPLGRSVRLYVKPGPFLPWRLGRARRRAFRSMASILLAEAHAETLIR